MKKQILSFTEGFFIITAIYLLVFPYVAGTEAYFPSALITGVFTSAFQGFFQRKVIQITSLKTLYIRNVIFLTGFIATLIFKKVLLF